MYSMFGSLNNTLGWRVDLVDLLMPATLLIHSLSFIVFVFECLTISFDVFGFLAIIADSIVSRFAPTSLVIWPSWRTSPLTVWSVGRTLHYISIIGWIICKQFPSTCFNLNCTRDWGVFDSCNQRIAHHGDKSFPWRRKTAHEQHWSQFIFDRRPLGHNLGT